MGITFRFVVGSSIIMTSPTMITADFENAHYIVLCMTTMISSLLFLFQMTQICRHFNPMNCEKQVGVRSMIKCTIRFHVAMFTITVLILCAVIVLMPIVLDICLVTVCVSLVMTSLTLSLLWITILTKHSHKMAVLQMFVVSNGCYFANCWMTHELINADTFSFNALKVMVVAAVITNGMLWTAICSVFRCVSRDENESGDGGYREMEENESLV